MKGVTYMKFTQSELKEIWARSDEYFRFTYEEYNNFAARLKQWRALNDVTQTDMAEAIYEYRKLLGLEDDDISNVKWTDTYTGAPEFKPIDYEVTEKRKKKREQRINSIMRTYHQWENKETDSFSSNTPFSMNNLFILKQLLQCDYEFLFCEIDTPHKKSRKLSELTGLNLSTVEKLSSYDKSYKNDDNSSISAYYAHGILTALDKLISDDNLMMYLSYYLTNLNDDTSEDYLTVVTPVAGIPTEDAYMDGRDFTLNADAIDFVYMMTISNKLSQLREKYHESSTVKRNIPYVDEIILAEESDSFGERLKKWREYKRFTQTEVRDMIYNYYIDNKLRNKPSSDKEKKLLNNAILRTYQNWESKKDLKKDTRLSMSDLKMLKDITGCDYEYLFGEINSMTAPELSIYHSLGLSPENIEKLEAYATIYMPDEAPDIPKYANHILTAIDLIVTDNDLLSNLAYFLSDLEYDVNFNHSNILKPIKIYGLNIPFEDAYIHDLFPKNKELRNVFLPAIFTSLTKLRERNIYNNQLIIDQTNKEYPTE